MRFLKPTLITITAPTCSGKSFLLNYLTEQDSSLFPPREAIFTRIVSTTTRAPRLSEREGVDYNFISWQKSLEMEKNDEFAELINFRGTRYGVTKAEMQDKMGKQQAPVIIVEPEGVRIYEKFCRENGWQIFKVFVHTDESERIKRLNDRTAMDARNAFINTMQQSDRPDSLLFKLDTLSVMQKLINTHTDRLLSITDEERRWHSTSSWDAIVAGDNVEKAIQNIKQGIKWRNSQIASLNT